VDFDKQWTEAYKRYLTKLYYNDNHDRAIGRAPLPRSREEQLAIFWNLPLEKRRMKTIQKRYLGFIQKDMQ
jgi:hypothetical protein